MEMVIKYIKYNTSCGHGTIKVDLARLLPCSQHDFKILLDTIRMNWNPDELVEQLNGYIVDKVNELKAMRGKLVPDVDKTDIARVNADIKRYIALNAAIIKQRYDVEEIRDDEAEIKLKKSTVYALVRGQVKTFEGWTFQKSGLTFDVYKKGEGRTASYIILLNGTGSQVAECAKKGEAIATVTPKLIGLLTKNPGKLDEYRECFKKKMIEAGYMEPEPEPETSEDETRKEAHEDTQQNQEHEEEQEVTTMAINYFEGTNTLDDLRAKYRDLLKVNHPDNGGSTEVMQEVNAQYKVAFDLLKSGATITTARDAEKWDSVGDEAIRSTLAKVVNFPGLNIEVVGTWIWIDGDSFPVKEELKKCGFQWSRQRRKWHYTPNPKPTYYKGGKRQDFGEICTKYGSTKIKSEGAARLAD